VLTFEVSTALHSLWTESRVQAAIQSSPKLQSYGSFLYFMHSIFRISEKDYTPTDADIVRFKLLSPPVTETPLEIVVPLPDYTDRLKTNLGCVHRDIGLQRKWFSVFTGDAEAIMIVFLVDLCSYDEINFSPEMDEYVLDDMREAMTLFDFACSRLRWQRPTMVLLVVRR
ncbi:guanine nucleotide binding protein, alpha subunit, partial [Mycena leptocephala]